MGLVSDTDDYWPWFVSGIGACLGLVLLGEAIVLFFVSHHFPEAYWIGVVSSVVPIVGLIYGGYWVATSDLPRERYGRLASWVIAGGVVFLILNLLIMLSMPPETLIHAIGWGRWAVSLGGGVGLLIGAFEARAIERARAAERIRVKHQEAERQNELLDEFASIVSHDLRNPLNVAQGRLQLAQDEVDSRHLDDIETALDRMATIIEETLLLAREGKAVREPKPVDLDSLVEESWRSVDTRSAELLTESLPTVEADAERLRHVFENLFRNAVEHGGEDVTVRVGQLDDENGFFVQDDGPGIPPGEADDLFDPEDTTTEGGSGFGLAIVNRIIQAHGWEIRVTTGDEGGARFEITGVGVVEQPRPQVVTN